MMTKTFSREGYAPPFRTVLVLDVCLYICMYYPRLKVNLFDIFLEQFHFIYYFSSEENIVTLRNSQRRHLKCKSVCESYTHYICQINKKRNEIERRKKKVYKNKKANSSACPHTHIICIYLMWE